MKIAILGKGKTGSKVIELCEQRNIEHTVFDSINQPTTESLKSHDVILCFLTGEVFTQYIELLSQVRIPVVTGATGFEWTKERLDLVNQSNVAWIHANNFSLGMSIAKQMIKLASRANTLLSDAKYQIHEVHHTDKVDAPSGTAKAWQSWLGDVGQETQMTYDRVADVIGEHELTLKTPSEQISIKHSALSRTLFAQGALWACEKISGLEPGLTDFSILTMQELIKE